MPTHSPTALSPRIVGSLLLVVGVGVVLALRPKPAPPVLPYRPAATAVLRPRPLESQPHAVHVSLQFLDANGDALSKRRLDVGYTEHYPDGAGSASRWIGLEAHTDDLGRATIRCPLSAADAEARTLEFVDGAPNEGSSSARTGLVLLPNPVESDTLDLGVLALVEPGDDILLRNLDDDALEREFDRLVPLAALNGRHHAHVVVCLLEMARRGGEPWDKRIGAIWAKRGDGWMDSPGPDTPALEELEALTLLRRAQRRADPGEIRLHSSCAREFVIGEPMRLEIGLVNVDADESFWIPPYFEGGVRITARDTTGRSVTPKPQQRTIDRPPYESPKLAPRTASWDWCDGLPWSIEISHQLNLAPGRYTLELQAPVDGYWDLSEPLRGRVTLKSAPFEIVVHAPR